MQSINHITMKHCTDCRPSVLTDRLRYRSSKYNV